MSTVTASQAVKAKSRTIIFSNRLPLRTRQMVHEIFLGHVDRDFGGRYFCWCECSREPGKYHCWHQHNSPYTDGRSYERYIGLFGSYEELLPLLAGHGYEMIDQGNILLRLSEEYEDGSPGEITLPEC